MKLLNFIYFIIVFTSCSYKIYVNGHFSHKLDKSYSYKNSSNDSCIILEDGKSDVTDSASYINEIRIKYGYSADSFQQYSIDYSLLEMAKTQAKVYHANVIKICRFKRYSCCETDQLVVQLYHLKIPLWEILKNKIDSLNYADAGFHYIHIKHKRLYSSKYPIPIYVNNYIIGYCSNVGDAVFSFNIPHRSNLSIYDSTFINNEIKFYNKANKYSSYHPTVRYIIPIYPNKEYYFHILDTKGNGHILQTVSKFDF